MEQIKAFSSFSLVDQVVKTNFATLKLLECTINCQKAQITQLKTTSLRGHQWIL